MRNNIVHTGADELTYEIREIVEIANNFAGLGVKIHWENIGDPVAKGEVVPRWIKDIVISTVNEDKSYAYCSTSGVLGAREYISKYKKEVEGINLEIDDILFFNGLGDAISIIYSYLGKGIKVIGPSPAYPTHSSADEAHTGTKYITYKLNPKNNWEPDTKEIEDKIKADKLVNGILTINPDNPTGFVYSQKTLEEIVKIAKKYDLFVISDEIYKNLTYNIENFISVGKIAEDLGVPAIILRGLSKEVPWPGARCGWAEFINRDKDTNFDKYVKSLFDAKMLEVCSTTLPQMVMPKIFEDSRFEVELSKRREKYKKRADIAYNIFKKVSNITAPKPSGAFYISVVFDEGVLNSTQTLTIADDAIKECAERAVKNVPLDKRFAYYLMATTGICVVPLSGFNSDLLGFRITLLEKDEKEFKKIFKTVADKIVEYLEH